jgi:hypothetical protein
MSRERQNDERIQHFSGRIVAIVRCFSEGSTRDHQDDFPLDEHTLITGFQCPMYFNIAPVSELRGACSLEMFMRALPQRYFAFQTFNMCYGQVTIDGAEVFLMSSPFGESPLLTYVEGVLHPALEVRAIFLAKRRSKFNDAIMEATRQYDTFIQTRTGSWRPYDKKRSQNMRLPPMTEREDQHPSPLPSQNA